MIINGKKMKIADILKIVYAETNYKQELINNRKDKKLMPKRKKTQNRLLYELYLKNQMHEELKRFKAMQKLPQTDRLTTKQKWTRFYGIIRKCLINNRKDKKLMPKRKKTQNRLLYELYLKNQMHEELKRFKAMQKLPQTDRLTTKQKWTTINEIINKPNG